MAFHIVLDRPTDLAGMMAAAEAGQSPRHSMAVLAEQLGATVHDGTGLRPGFVDRLLGKVTRMQPRWWMIARAVRRNTSHGDVIYCTGEDVGLPVALLCGAGHGAKVAIMAHATSSAKKRLALRLFDARRRVAQFFVVSPHQQTALQQALGKARAQVAFVWDQTDTAFFAPGPPSPAKTRPCIASVGLERRDYTTLARATADLDLDVRISGHSENTRVLQNAFPPELPANMSRRFYPWDEFQQLYRDADVVVVSVFPNDYAAGVQGLMEGMACGRPVIVTPTEGLAGYVEEGAAIAVRPGDPAALRQAIEQLLADPTRARSLASAAHALAGERHSLDGYVGTIAAHLRQLA
jgi:hypothetical protein